MSQFFLLLFAIASLVCSVARSLFDGALSQTLEYASKPLLMPLLALFFAATGNKTVSRNMVYIALFFAWGGDMLLMLASTYPEIPVLFLGGLGSFLVMQLLYWKIYSDAAIKTSQPTLLRQKPYFLLPVGIVALGFYIAAFPTLDIVLKIAVFLYAVCLSGMVIFAMQRWQRTPEPSFKAVLIGASLFMISDLMIGINRFVMPFPGAGLAIMLTYTLGQGLIVWGLSKHSVQ